MIIRNRSKQTAVNTNASDSNPTGNAPASVHTAAPAPEFDNGKYGTLQVQTFTARRTLPVSGATVTVSRRTQGDSELLYTQTTDSAGMTSQMKLPGIPKDVTLSPDTDFGQIADMYSYDIVVTHPGYVTMLFNRVPIYEGIASIQNADMIPEAVSPNPGKPIIIDEYRQPI